MKNIFGLLILLGTSFCIFAQNRNKEANSLGFVKKIEISGHLGNRINQCISNRIGSADISLLIEPFTKKNETHFWQSEFWGKWMLGAVDSYKYTLDPALYQKITYAVNGLLKTQLPNGYIGNYTSEAQFTQWDIWGMKYTLLGLLSYYDISNDKKALESSIKLADFLLSKVGPNGRNIVTLGNYYGMAASSILEPIMHLYNRTHEERYFTFAKYIINQWETPQGPKLISKAISGVPVSERFLPFPKDWVKNGQKAYEMMSCYVGLLEFYKISGDPIYLNSVERSVKSIIDDEINIAGSGSAFECWFGGKNKQTQAAFSAMETCVTITWMQLCRQLLLVTGNSIYADQIEKTTYNALMASMSPDGSKIEMYTPLEGNRHSGPGQCGMNFNCCEANGPRGFVMLPMMAYHFTNNKINVNLYAASKATIVLPEKNIVDITQITDYPADGNISITVNPQQESQFAIALRIPEWSKEVSLSLNGQKDENGIKSGNYYTISRKWQKGDKIELKLDLRAKVIELNHFQAIVRGPVLMARDSWFSDGFTDETVIIENKDSYVDLIPMDIKPDFAWMSFTANAVVGTNMQKKDAFRTIHLCDFSSAGNSWDVKQRYRVWLPKTLDVQPRGLWW
jgi:DUF1680 family protein